MIKDHTIDQCLVELARTMAALKALREERKTTRLYGLSTCNQCFSVVHTDDQPCKRCGSSDVHRVKEDRSRQHAAALRASLDLTRKLADLRQGR